MPVRSFVCVENSSICLFLTHRELSGKKTTKSSEFVLPAFVFHHPTGVNDDLVTMLTAISQRVLVFFLLVSRLAAGRSRSLHVCCSLDDPSTRLPGCISRSAWTDSTNPWKGLALLDAKQHHVNPSETQAGVAFSH